MWLGFFIKLLGYIILTLTVYIFPTEGDVSFWEPFIIGVLLGVGVIVIRVGDDVHRTFLERPF